MIAEPPMPEPTIVAEQTSQNRYFRSGSLTPTEIELTVRLVIPEEEGADVGITAEFAPDVPTRWEDRPYERLYRRVHSGLASVGSPLPRGGIEVEIVRVRVSPQLGGDSTTEEVLRIGDTLEALTAATVGGLWAGLLRLGSLSAAGIEASAT